MLSAIKKSGAGFSVNPRILEILLVVGFGFATLRSNISALQKANLE